jgi:DNA polymerase delta subunit 3
MPDVTPAKDKDSQELAQEKPSPTQPNESESAVTISQGARRRGRRKVMKKKKVKDEDGYLGKRHVLSSIESTITDYSSDYRRTRVGVIFRRRTPI